jgi:glycosyltransferase involved in cell wall biosynthesis
MQSNVESKIAKYWFTVFTATYNRAHTLSKTYESLNRQTFRDFEWIIVDDGSIDETAGLVKNWINEADFPIIYRVQKNSGKHVAINLGVSLSEGELFLIVDSDDTIEPETLKTFKYYWIDIPIPDRCDFSTISARCKTPEGDIVGNPFSFSVKDIQNSSEQLLMRKKGELFGVNTVASMKEFPFPEIEGERFIPEGIVWNRISKKYSARFINIPLRVYVQLEEGLSKTSDLIRYKSPYGAYLNYKEQLDMILPIAETFKIRANFYRYAFHSDNFKFFELIIKDIIALPVAYILYRLDVVRLGS